MDDLAYVFTESLNCGWIATNGHKTVMKMISRKQKCLKMIASIIFPTREKTRSGIVDNETFVLTLDTR